MASSDRVQAEVIRVLYRNVPVEVACLFAGAVLMSAGLFYIAPERLPSLLVFIAASVAVSAGQLGLWAWHRSAPRPDGDWRVWARRLIVVTILDGARWGFGSIWVTTPGAIDQQMWVCMVVGGAACGSVASLGAYLPAYVSLIIPGMWPYFIWAGFQPDPRYWAVGALGAMLSVATSLFSHRQSRALSEALRLRFENLDLAESLREANLAKTQFLAAASHDLRQPMHALGLLVAALSRTRQPADGRRLTGQIAEAVDAMGGLFSSLLDVSQLDAGVIKPLRQPLAIGPMLERICREQAAELGDGPVTLRWVATSAVVDSDPVLLERMLRNLIANAAKYTREGRILVGCRRQGRRLLVQVWDTGPGIAPEHQAQVFQEFYQVANPERDRAKGLGLGLAITRRVSLLLESPVVLQSQPGRGSVFSISVPLADAGAEPVEPDTPVSAGPQHGLVFVIDDEAMIQQGMSQLLGAWGYEVAAAGSAAELLARADRGRRPDLVVCDWRLRGQETGMSAIAEVRAVYGDTPAVLITGDTDPARLRAAADTGLVLLHKPVPPGKLRAAVGNLIGNRA